MKLDAIMGEGNTLTVEYDTAGQEALIKAGILSGLWKAIDSDKIGQLEQEVAILKKKNRKLRRKLREK
jgi:hypothetical protein